MGGRTDRSTRIVGSTGVLPRMGDGAGGITGGLLWIDGSMCGCTPKVIFGSMC
jgi:hypothetical protein